MIVPFGTFVSYIRTSPSLVAKLMARLPAPPPDITAGAVVAAMDDLPIEGEDTSGRYEADPTSKSTFPSGTYRERVFATVEQLYQLFCHFLKADQLGELALSQQEVVDYLMNSHIPLRCHFVLDRLVYAWDPMNFHFTTFLFEDDHISRACKKYLVERGAVYASLEEASRAVISQQWPGWQAISDRR